MAGEVSGMKLALVYLPCARALLTELPARCVLGTPPKTREKYAIWEMRSPLLEEYATSSATYMA